MIRGTNKRIIEISGEDGSCFERIVLFLRPEEEGCEGRALKLAEDYADGIFRQKAAASLLKERKRRSLPKGGAAAAAILAAVAIGAILLCLALL